MASGHSTDIVRKVKELRSSGPAQFYRIEITFNKILEKLFTN